MSILDISKKPSDPVVVAYNGSPDDLGTPATVNYGASPTGAYTANVDILRRQYNNDDSGLFTSLLPRHLGFDEDSGGVVTLIFKDDDGDRHDFTTGTGLWKMMTVIDMISPQEQVFGKQGMQGL